MVLWSCSRCRRPNYIIKDNSVSISSDLSLNNYSPSSNNNNDNNGTDQKCMCKYQFSPRRNRIRIIIDKFKSLKKIVTTKCKRIFNIGNWLNIKAVHLFVLILITNLVTENWVLSRIIVSASASSTTNHHVTSHTVVTKYGALRGIKVQFSSSSTRHLDPVSAFLGIPYASPPVNAYRFMPPVAPLPWGPGTRVASTLPPACPQRFPDISNYTKALQSMTIQRYILLQKLIPFVANQSEDCLYLNFYVPTVPPGEEIRPGKFAIVFVIHGESWEWGTGNEFDGGIMASIGNHIVVTFNYRLGMLGFLKTSNQQSNFGLLDVIAALHWVRENGDAFGGDRNRISILGYRTGAVIANLLMVAQIAKDLFQRAILISGSILSPWALQWNPEEVAFQASIHFGCKGRLPLSHHESDIAPCLRRKELNELLDFVPNSPRFLSPFAPFIDNILLKNPRPLMMDSLKNAAAAASAAASSNAGGASNNNANTNPGSSSSSSVAAALSEQFHSAQLIIIFTTSEGVHELNDHELRHGFELEHRDRIIRTLVRNVFNYHQQEIFSIIRNEYTDWDRPIVHPIPLRDATVEALSDCLVIAPVIQLALSHSTNVIRTSSSSHASPGGTGNSDRSDSLHGKSTYLLHFSHVSREVDFTPYERLGSLEGDVVPYVMGLPVTNNIPPFGGQQFLSPWSSLANFSKQDAIVSETLLHYLSNFIRSGDPNANDPSSVVPSSQFKQYGLDLTTDEWSSSGTGAGGTSREKIRTRSLYWEPFEINTQLYLNIGIKPKLKSHYRGHKLALWLNLIPQIHLSGGSEVALNHHTFNDDNPKHYIGTIRHHYQLSFRDQIPGVESNIFQKHQSYENDKFGFGGMTAVPPGTNNNNNNNIGTTECIETTAEGFPQGSPNQIEIEEDSVRMNVGVGGSSPHSHISGFEVVNGEYDYTTALTVTLTVGICLILLNLVVFSAIMCHRKRGLASETLSMSTTGSPGSRHGGPGGGGGAGNSGTPLKSPYKNDFKWTSCSPTSQHQGGVGATGTGGATTSSSHLSYPGESIALSQYHLHHHHHPQCPDHSAATAEIGVGNSPSPNTYAQLDFNRTTPMNCCSNSSTLMRNTAAASSASAGGIAQSHYNNTQQQQQQYSEDDDDDENERPLSPFMIMAAAAAAEMIQQQEQQNRQYHYPHHHLHQNDGSKSHHYSSNSRVHIPFNSSSACTGNSNPLLNQQQQLLPPPPLICDSSGNSNTGGGGSIRLYMNQSAAAAGDDHGLIGICGGTNSLPRNLYHHQYHNNTCPNSTCNNTNSLSRLKPTSYNKTCTSSSTTTNPNIIQSPSSSATTTSLSTTPITANPSTTLVGVLKRHTSGSGGAGSSSNSTSTVKKRVQIQEISV